MKDLLLHCEFSSHFWQEFFRIEDFSIKELLMLARLERSPSFLRAESLQVAAPRGILDSTLNESSSNLEVVDVALSHQVWPANEY